MFHTLPDSKKLSQESAEFVDVIHAAGLWIGTDEVVGKKKSCRVIARPVLSQF